jgi:hypothetical protein
MQMIQAIIQPREDWVASSRGLPVRHSTIEYVSDDPIDEVGRVEDDASRGRQNCVGEFYKLNCKTPVVPAGTMSHQWIKRQLYHKCG